MYPMDGLTCAGIEPPAELKALATNNVQQALGLGAEAGRLKTLLAAQGIAMAVVKGPALSLLLYGTPGLRQCKDLDIWVSPADVPRALGQLQAGGYDVIDGPPASAGPWLDLWLDMRKDSTARQPATGRIVELHHRLTENPHVVAQLKVADATCEVALGGGGASYARRGRSLRLPLHPWDRIPVVPTEMAGGHPGLFVWAQCRGHHPPVRSRPSPRRRAGGEPGAETLPPSMGSASLSSPGRPPGR